MLDEPYLRLQVNKLQRDQYKSLKSGKMVIPGAAGYVAGSSADYSPLLVGVADPTNSLRYNEVFPVVSGAQISRPAGHNPTDPFEAIAYRDPGMSPGDIRKVVISQSPELCRLLASFGEHSGLERMNVVFISTQGDPRHNNRSLADMLAGGDYDGDQFQIIVWQDLVRLCVNESPPYDPKAALPPIVKGNGRQLCTCDLCTLSQRKSQAEARDAAAAAAAEAKAAEAAKNAKPAPTPPTPQEAQAASAAARASRGKEQLEQEAARLRLEQERLAEQRTREKQVEVALISNFLMAKFMSSPMVGTSANNWKILTAKYADKGGCSHPKALHLAHEYLEALDAEGRERLEKHFYRHLPQSLRSNEFPAQ